MKEIVIDGRGAVMGRLASYSAKKALEGFKVKIVNANEVIIVGNKQSICEKYKRLLSLGGSSMKGPRISRTPERILKRAIRGMLKHKKMRGRVAIKKINCYNETPEELKEKEKITLNEKNKKEEFISLKELVMLIK